MRTRGGAAAAPPEAMATGGAGSRGTALASNRGAARPAMVFIVAADGTIEPRMVRIGLNDWDNTQVVSGLEDGETIAVIGAAQLQAQQAEMLERMRSRMGGGGPVVRMR